MNVSGMGQTGWTAVLWLARAYHRMVSRAKHDEDLTPTQREALTTEANGIRELAVGLLAQSRSLEDFLLWVLFARREDTYVLDALCDGAHTEVWAILGLKQALLASVNKSRDDVLGAPLTTIKKSGRAKTVKYARDVVREMRSLPEFPERDGLATKLERRGQALDAAIDALLSCETEESDHRVEIDTAINTAKTNVIRAYGRLLDVFPRPEVEALFPRRESRTAASADEPEEPTEPTP